MRSLPTLALLSASLCILSSGCILHIDRPGYGHNMLSSKRGDLPLAGSGVLRSEPREVPPFHSVRSRGSFDVRIRVGEPQSLTISGDDNLLGLVSSEVHDGRLTLEMHSGNYNPRRPLKVEAVVAELKAVELIGSGDLEVEGVDTSDFEARICGSGDMQIQGRTESLVAQISGSGDMDFDDLQAQKAWVSVSGSGDMRLFVSGELSGSVTGSGDVRCRGGAEVESFSSRGSGSLDLKQD